MTTSDRQWAILRVRAIFPFLVVRYSDSSRRRVEKRLDWLPSFSHSLPLGELIAVLRLAKLLADLPPAPHPLPVFLDIPEIFGEAPPFAAALPSVPGAKLLRLSPTRPVRRTPFRLPLRIVVAGEDAGAALAQFRSSGWLQEEGVAELGIRISSVQVENLARVLRRDGADIVVTGDHGATVRACRQLGEHHRPRLLIDLLPRGAQIPKPLPGAAELGIPIAAGAFLNDFLRELTHDQPLHAAVLAARSLHRTPAELIADPLSNQSLRLFDAFLRLRHEVERVHPSIAPQEALGGLKDITFARETEGVVPMARMMLAMQSAHRDFEQQQRANWTPSIFMSVDLPVTEPADLRVVNVGLRRMETEPPLSVLPGDRALISGAAYELKVDIGDRSPESLVSGPQPAPGPLLPPPEGKGHELEVAIHAKDFRLLSPRVQKLLLPRHGPSEPVYFRIRTPRESSAAGLRICVYFRNQLVQSYTLLAAVAPAPVSQSTEPRVENGVSVRLEYSRSKDQPWEVEGLQERALSIGANQAGRTHQLIFKSTGASGEVTLPESTFDQEVQDLRTQLDGLIADSSGQERTYLPVPAGTQPAPDIADAFRQLVRRGREVYLAFSNEASKAGLKKTLLAVAGGADQKLQVVRFVDQFVFPWAMLYDFPLPDERAGDPPLPICLGEVTDSSGTTVACGHTNKDEVYCVRGFWGVRHFVEEMLVQGAGKVTSLPRPATGPVRVVAASNLAESAILEGDLRRLESATETGPFAAAPLLDLLWADPSERPAILILLAHFAEEDLPAQPLGPRVLLGGSEWLTLNLLSNRVAGSAGWDDPRPILMQMTCNAAKVDSATVNHFLTQWNTAGAAAIIGTEARVGPGVAADCALSVTTGLWAGKQTLGEAVTGFRRKLVFSGNPLGFLFTAYGDVDLVVP